MMKTRKYMEWAVAKSEEVEAMTKATVKGRNGERVEEEWRHELVEKSSLRINRSRKKSMKKEVYDDSPEARIWLRARLNCLGLEDRNRFRKGGVAC